LSGSEWYCHQAFRALNQAAGTLAAALPVIGICISWVMAKTLKILIMSFSLLGRCIRHKSDYGGIILIGKLSSPKHLHGWAEKIIPKILVFDCFDYLVNGVCHLYLNFDVMCIDERYQENRNLAYISKWLRTAIKQYDSFQDTMDRLQKFFQNAEVLLLLHL
jgi:Fanconi anemia group J protein